MKKYVLSVSFLLVFSAQLKGQDDLANDSVPPIKVAIRANEVLPKEKIVPIQQRPKNEVWQVLNIEPTEAIPKSSPALERPQDLSNSASPLAAKFLVFNNGKFPHGNLIFEEPMLERNGCSRRPPMQLGVSSLSFFSRSVVLPFRLILRR